MNQEGLMMCTNRLIESLKKYPEVKKKKINIYNLIFYIYLIMS